MLAVVVVLFGGAKIPQLARSLGRAQKEFKEGLHDETAKPDDAATTESTTKPDGAEATDSHPE